MYVKILLFSLHFWLKWNIPREIKTSEDSFSSETLSDTLFFNSFVLKSQYPLTKRFQITSDLKNLPVILRLVLKTTWISYIRTIQELQKYKRNTKYVTLCHLQLTRSTHEYFILNAKPTTIKWPVNENEIKGLENRITWENIDKMIYTYIENKITRTSDYDYNVERVFSDKNLKNRDSYHNGGFSINKMPKNPEIQMTNPLQNFINPPDTVIFHLSTNICKLNRSQISLTN